MKNKEIMEKHLLQNKIDRLQIALQLHTVSMPLADFITTRKELQKLQKQLSTIESN